MNIYEKLQQARVSLQNAKLKKTGKNDFSHYDYFELGDFLPTINNIMQEVKLCSYINFTSEIATLTIINSEKPEEIINFTCPMSTAQLKGCHEVQNLGAVQTYIRRYLYINAFEISEHDALDATTGKEDKPKQSKEPPKDNVRDLIPNVDSVKCQDCGKEMKPAEVSYSQKFYQANICMACQKKHTRIEGAK